MSYLITGGAGFVGTNLGQALAAEGEAFRILDRRPSQLFADRGQILDILDADQLAQSMSGETIYHLAAEHRDDVRPLDLYEKVNVEGTRNVARAAALRGVARIVFTSSVAVYGFAAPGTGEDGPINPFNEYGRTKYAAEGVLREWQAGDPARRSLVILRPTVIFGPGNRGNVFNLFSQIASGRFLMVGNGRNLKSMAYVENIVAFLRHVARAPAGVHLFNYVDKPDQNMNDLVAHVRETVLKKPGTGPRLPLPVGMALGHLADGVARVTGRKLPVSAIRVKKFVSTTAFSSAAHGAGADWGQGTETAGFTAPVPLAEGIRRTLEAEFLHPDPNRPIFYTE